MSRDKDTAEARHSRALASIQRVKDRFRVTRVICTRSATSEAGEVYVGLEGGLSDAWGGPAGAPWAPPEAAEPEGAASPMDLKEARVAALVLGMQVDVLVAQRSWAGSGGSAQELSQQIAQIEADYASLILDLEKP